MNYNFTAHDYKIKHDIYNDIKVDFYYLLIDEKLYVYKLIL